MTQPNLLARPLPGSARIEAAIAARPKRTLIVGFIAGAMWATAVGVLTVVTAR